MSTSPSCKVFIKYSTLPSVYKSYSKSLNQIGKDEPHAFGKVPIIEYKNNPEFLGDFEPVISLIDAYNLLQSDRVQ